MCCEMMLTENEQWHVSLKSFSQFTSSEVLIEFLESKAPTENSVGQVVKYKTKEFLHVNFLQGLDIFLISPPSSHHCFFSIAGFFHEHMPSHPGYTVMTPPVKKCPSSSSTVLHCDISFNQYANLWTLAPFVLDRDSVFPNCQGI